MTGALGYCATCARKDAEIEALKSALRACPKIPDTVLRFCVADNEREIATTIRNLILAELLKRGVQP